MNQSSEIAIELLQSLIDSPKLEVLLSEEEVGCLKLAINQITYLEDRLRVSSIFQKQLMADTIAQHRL